MLSVGSIGSASGASDYYAADSYYTQGELSEHSEWAGKGAEALELKGNVDAKTFEAILSGKLPNGETISHGLGKHRPGFDLAFSAPKSVSLLALVGGDQRLTKAHFEAVKQTMAWAEKYLAEGRSGKNGKNIEKTGSLTYALFQHNASRNLDPNLHVHALVANMTQRADGKWCALHNDKLFKENMLLGAVYHAQFRAAAEKLGYQVELTGKNGMFEIAGISRDTIESWSTRHRDINEKAAELGIQSAKGRGEIATRTREDKGTVDQQALHADWQEQAALRGDNFQKLIDRSIANTGERGILSKIRTWGEALLDRLVPHLRSTPDPLLKDTAGLRRGPQLAASYAVASGVRHLGEREATFAKKELLRSALNFAEKGADVSQIEHRIEALTSNRALIEGKGKRSGQITTPEMQRIEKSIIAISKDGDGQAKPILPPERAEQQLDQLARNELGFPLYKEQLNVAREILSGPDRFMAIQGGAGTGKSTLFKAVKSIADKQGVPIKIITSQNQLASKLQEDTGIEAMTVARFLTQYESVIGKSAGHLINQGRKEYAGSILLLDEASMISNRHMQGLMRITERLKINKLVMTGDVRQIPSIEAGQPFYDLQRTGTATSQLSNNVRQSDPAMRSAIADLQSGQIEAAFKKLTPHVQENANPASAAAKKWLALPDALREKTALFTSGHKLRTQVLDVVRSELVKEDKLGAKEHKLDVLENLNLTRAQLRQTSSYATGMTLDAFKDDIATGLGRGSYKVAKVDQAKGKVHLTNGKRGFSFRPSKLHPNGKGVALMVPQELSVREGDKLMWTGTDHKRGLSNGESIKLTQIKDDRLQFEKDNGDKIKLEANDPMAKRLGHALVLNMHRAQGLTVENAITVMDSGEKYLSNQSLLYVLSSRHQKNFTLHVDNSEKLRVRIEMQIGGKLSALDIAPELKQPLNSSNPNEDTPAIKVVEKRKEALFPTTEPIFKSPERALDGPTL